MKCGIIILAAFATACGRSPAAPPPVITPTPVLPVTAEPFSGRLVVSGQSNAVNVVPYLAAYGQVDTVAQHSLSISHWSAINPEVFMWRILQPVLRSPMRAFVWWQGESDSANPNYQAQLLELMERVRAEAQQSTLRVVIVRVLAKPAYQRVRTAQEQVAQMFSGTTLASIDHCEVDGLTDHLTPDGYRCAAVVIVNTVNRLQ
jgi:hypothetical protein